MIKIKVNNNGSYMVESDEPIELVNGDGQAIPHEGKRLWLCRCGGSANKPFCDSTHKRIGFESVIQVDPPAAG